MSVTAGEPEVLAVAHDVVRYHAGDQPSGGRGARGKRVDPADTLTVSSTGTSASAAFARSLFLFMGESAVYLEGLGLNGRRSHVSAAVKVVQTFQMSVDHHSRSSHS